MKRFMALLLVTVFLAGITGCTSRKEHFSSEPENIQGYMYIEGDTLYFDKVEIITTEDKERIAELGLTAEHDMPSGYHIYNPDIEWAEYKLTNNTIYTFFDFSNLFIKGEDSDKLYSTTKKEEFIQYLKTTYTDTPPAQKVPFFIQVKDSKVLSIEEKVQFTI